jgi:hypothetical protein
MHDFRELVGPRRKEDPREQEIVSELAGHLEEIYLDLLCTGASEGQALALVSAMGKNLGSTVRRLRWQREGGLRTWLRAVVLPGLILSFMYEACRTLLVDFHWEQPFLWRETNIVLIGVALGFCASSLSRELGGNKSHRLWAGMFVISLPAAVWCVMGLLVAPLQWIQGSQHRLQGTISGVAGSLLWVLLWDVVIPAAGLAMGAAISALAFSPTSPDLRKPKIA